MIRRWVLLSERRGAGLRCSGMLVGGNRTDVACMRGLAQQLARCLTKRLLLRVLASHGELPAGRVFTQLMQQDEPLPYLGDMMFHALLQPLLHAPHPLLREGPATPGPIGHYG